MITLTILLWHRDPPESDLNTALSPLPKGRTNPPLERVGAKWPIPEETPVWYGTNQLPAGTIVQSEADHEFEDRTEDAVAIRFSNSTLVSWVTRRSTKALWIEAK
jgi:hypothetical protein